MLRWLSCNEYGLIMDPFRPFSATVGSGLQGKEWQHFAHNAQQRYNLEDLHNDELLLDLMYGHNAFGSLHHMLLGLHNLLLRKTPQCSGTSDLQRRTYTLYFAFVARGVTRLETQSNRRRAVFKHRCFRLLQSLSPTTNQKEHTWSERARGIQQSNSELACRPSIPDGNEGWTAFPSAQSFPCVVALGHSVLACCL